jgi:riboflavin synthase
MFTGIIQTVGQITAIKPLIDTKINTINNPEAGLNICIQVSDSEFLKNTCIGDSICIQGACMTVVNLSENTFSFDISAYSIALIANMALQTYVNLEKAAHAHTFLGGHIVTGHVDGVAKIHALYALNESYILTIAIDNLKNKDLGQYIASKGSLTINGVSLTTNLVEDKDNYTYVTCNLIPHTIEHTTFKYLKVGSCVNIEIDILARYVNRMLQFKNVANIY